MLSAKDFRRIALAMQGAVESAHMGHPDFRVNSRIFATLHPDHQSGMVKFTPDQQQIFVRENPAAFTPENGAWGRQGCTRVLLDSVDEDKLGEALTLAWQNIVNKGQAGGSTRKRRSIRSI
jgi:hypothetical protein